MDKLKDFWRVLKRIHFWLICVIVLLVTVAVWFLEVGKLADEKKKLATDYQGLFGQLTTETKKTKIPNDDVATAMAALTAERTGEIRQAWERKFEQQNSDQTGILTWPKDDDKFLDAEFVAHMEALRPIERHLTFPLPEDLDDIDLNISKREGYREFIEEELERLAESIGAKWQANAKGAAGAGAYGGEGAYGGGGDGGGYSDYGGGGRAGGVTGAAGAAGGESLSRQAVVHWAPASQAEVKQTHFTWGDKLNARAGMAGAIDDEPTPPTVAEILYAQEDLWALRAVMRVIKLTNGDASTRYNAAVKTIHSIKIGKEAVASTGLILRLVDPNATPGAAGGEAGASEYGAEGGGGGGYDDYAGGGGGDPYGGMGGGAAGGAQYHSADGSAPAGEGAGAEGAGGSPYGGGGGYADYGGDGGGMMGPGSLDPAEGRYVDKDYKPLSATDLRTVMTLPEDEELEPEKAYLAVAKRIPVRMRLSVDQSKMTDLLVACANAELTIEVRQLRWNPEDLADSTGQMTSGRGGGGYGGDGGGYGGAGGAKPAAGPTATPFPKDVTVEIYGIIYLYNPVDGKALGEEPPPGEVSFNNRIRQGGALRPERQETSLASR